MTSVPPITLADLPPDALAGPNLELDAQFGALERAARGRPETQFGSTVEPATPPDWAEAASLALALLGQTRDLRVLAHLAVARLHLAGVPGFAGVLAAIRAQLEGNWDAVHPQLDPEDDFDPMQRANALLRLQDPAGVLRPLRDMPLASPPRDRTVSWRDIAVLGGVVEAEPGRERLSEAAIQGAFRATDRDRLAALRDAVDAALSDLAAIPAVFDARAGHGSGPDFKELSRLFRDLQRDLRRFEPSAEEAMSEDAGAAPPLRGGATVQSVVALSSRDEALHALSLAAAYFRANEPSSPLPLLIDRAIRLAGMEFLDILRDLAPDGLPQASIVAGTATE